MKSSKNRPLLISVQQWEAVCKQCGLCCFEKSTDALGQYHTTRVACRFLDVVERQCRVYHKRFSTGEECLKLTPEIIKTADWLPRECAYRQLLHDHPGLQVDTREASNSRSQRFDETPPPPE